MTDRFNVCTVSVQFYEVELHGCPQGVEALDWRRSEDLPDDRADNRVVLRLGGGEAELRALVAAGGLATQGADGSLVIDRPSRVVAQGALSESGLSYEQGARLKVTPDQCRDLLRATEEDRCHILALFASQAQKRLDGLRAERDERRSVEEAERVARVEASRREREEAKQRKEAERADWIGAHGSRRLQRLAAEGIECRAVYMDERLAHDRPGWRWDREVYGSGDDPRNPPEEALDLLDEARATLPEGVVSSLRYWTVDACEEEHVVDEECEGMHNGWRGYAVTSEFLGRTIVFGGPEE